MRLRDMKKLFIALAAVALTACVKVYLAFGLSGQSAIAVVGLQAVLFLSVSSLPLPGQWV